MLAAPPPRRVESSPTRHKGRAFMKRLLPGLGAVLAVGVAVAWSGPKPAGPELRFQSEKLNPVTHLKLNNDPDDFQFAIVSDRTGGHRAKVFSRAVAQLNLLQP